MRDVEGMPHETCRSSDCDLLRGDFRIGKSVTVYYIVWCSALIGSHFCADANLKLDLKRSENKFNSRKILPLPI